MKHCFDNLPTIRDEYPTGKGFGMLPPLSLSASQRQGLGKGGGMAASGRGITSLVDFCRYK